MEEGINPAIRLDKWIQRTAYILTKRRPWLRTEMEQEIRLFMLAHPAEPDGVLKVGGRYRALDFLHSKRANYSYKNAFVHIGLDVVEAQGIQIDRNRNAYYPNSIQSDMAVAGEFIEFTRPQSHYVSHIGEDRIFEKLRIEELRSLCTRNEWDFLYDRFYMGLTFKEIGLKRGRSRSYASKLMPVIIAKIQTRYEERW